MNLSKRPKLIRRTPLICLSVSAMCLWFFTTGCRANKLTENPATPMSTDVPRPTLEHPSTPPCPLVDNSIDFLLYQGSDDTQRELIIYLLRPDGTSHPLIEGQLILGQPWSPDGRMFAFQRPKEPANSNHLSVLDLCTGEVKSVHLLGRSLNVYWSPDGRHLLYTAAGQNETVGIALYSFETGENEIVVEVSTERLWLSGWSPDSRKIALVSKQHGRYDVYVLDIASRVLQQITDSPAIEGLVYWSPTKNELLVGTFPAEEEYALDTGGPTIDTFYILGDSGKQLNLLGDSFRAWTAAWSPDSEEIVYSNYGELCIRDVGEQSDVCPLAEAFPAENYSVAFDEPAGWSASGNWLAFQLVERHQSPCYLTYILELSTNTVTEVEQQMCLGSPLYWLPRS